MANSAHGVTHVGHVSDRLFLINENVTEELF